MTLKLNDGRKHSVFLMDDGTLDTVIKVDGKAFRYDADFASHYRKSNGEMTREGLRALANDAISGMDDNDDDNSAQLEADIRYRQSVLGEDA